MTAIRLQKPHQTIYVQIDFGSESDANDFLDDGLGDGFKPYVEGNDGDSLVIVLNITPQNSESYFNALNYDHRIINWEILYDWGDGYQFFPQ